MELDLKGRVRGRVEVWVVALVLAVSEVRAEVVAKGLVVAEVRAEVVAEAGTGNG